jgi:F-type H+-transporting ATPase subunit delta
MLVTRLGKRYAKSLLDLATELNKLEETKQDMENILAATQSSRELRTFLKSPVVEGKKKASVINAIFEGKLADLTQRFIALMAKQGREGDLPAIAQGFLELYQAQKGIETAVITSAQPLSDAQAKALSTRLASSLGKEIIVEQHVDANMIGGMKLRVAGKEYNGSIAAKLRTLQKSFKDNPYIADF